MNNEIELFDWENLTILKNFNKNLHSIISTENIYLIFSELRSENIKDMFGV